MSYIDRTLISGEKILYRGHRHWITFFKAFFWLLLSALLYFYPVTRVFTILPLFVACILFLFSCIDYFMTELAVTNKRVLVKVGWISRSSMETSLQNISSIEVMQPFWGRILNYGTVVICDRGNVRSPFIGISKPLDFRRAVQEHLTNT